jgi:hypothetical protein
VDLGLASSQSAEGLVDPFDWYYFVRRPVPGTQPVLTPSPNNFRERDVHGTYREHCLLPPEICLPPRDEEEENVQPGAAIIFNAILM